MRTTVALENQIRGMKNYLLLKIEENDWHGVADAANDIRVLEKELEVTRDHIEILYTFNKVGGTP